MDEVRKDKNPLTEQTAAERFKALASQAVVVVEQPTVVPLPVVERVEPVTFNVSGDHQGVVDLHPSEVADAVPAPAPTPTSGGPRTVSIAELRAAYSAGGGAAALSDALSTTTYVKLDKDETLLRILPSGQAGDPRPWVSYQKHSVQRPKFSDALCLDWLFRERPDLVAMLKQEGRLTQRDVELWSKFGDPFVRVYDAIPSTPEWKDVRSSVGRSTANILLVVNRRAPRPAVGYLEIGTGLRRKIAGALNRYISRTGKDPLDINAGHDINIYGNGLDNKLRRYDSAELALEPSALGLPDDAKVPDLNAVVSAKFRSYTRKVDMLLESYPEILSSIGLTQGDFYGTPTVNPPGGVNPPAPPAGPAGPNLIPED